MQLTRSHLLFALMCLVWGATWIAVKFGLRTVPPCLFAGTRFVVAGAILLIIARLRGEAVPLSRRDLPLLAWVTLLMVASTYSLLFWGAQFVNSGLAAILDLAFMPVALFAISAAFRVERFSRGRAAGVALGVAGLLVLFGPKALAGGGGDYAREMLGGAAIVASAVTYSLGSVLARPLLGRYPAQLVSSLTMLGGGVVLVPASVALEPGAAAALSGRWGMAAWAGWAFLVLFGSLVGYTSYMRLIREWGASRAGSYAFVSPIIAVLLGVWVFGEAVTPIDLAGMAIMLAGAWLSLRPARDAQPGAWRQDQGLAAAAPVRIRSGRSA